MVGVTENLMFDSLPSLPSLQCQKRTTTPTLLGIDADSRAIILDHLLVNRVRKVPGAERIMLAENESDGEVRDIMFTHAAFFNVGPGAPPGPMHQKEPVYRTSLSIANVQVLQVCRQLFHEGATILYGTNHFVSCSNCHFGPVIPDFVGKSNMASIKMLDMELPLEVKLDLRTGLKNLLSILSEGLPGLCELNLRTTFHPSDNLRSQDGQSSTLEKEHRAMLYSAACITRHHPSLKKAIWEAKSGQLSAQELNDEWLTYQSRKYRLSVRMLANNRVVKFREYKRQYAFPIPEKAITKVSRGDERSPIRFLMKLADPQQDFVLDCRAIRNLGIDGLMGSSPQEFRLPDAASP